MRWPLFLSFTAGATVMAAELAASRLVAPYFGSSTPVWGALIAFVLAAMAVGAVLGGKAADRNPTLARLCAGLAVAAGFLALLPFVGRLLLGPAAEALLLARPGAAVARLLAFGAFAAVPLLILGASGPFLVRAVGLTGELGRRAGALSAMGSAGSIAGTLVAAMVVLPAVGTARTMALFALVLGGTAAVGLSWRWRWAPLLVPAVSFGFAPLALARHPLGIDAVESPYALVQTLQFPDGRRELILDQAYATQSIHWPKGYVTAEVFGHYRLAPAMVEGEPSSPRVLLLGLGAGTGARGILEAFPQARIVGVEIDPEVVAMAQRHFELPAPVELHVEDARTFLMRGAGPFDAIVVDAFRFPYVPFHLVTAEFDALLAKNLAPGGVVCVNVGRYGEEKDVVRAVAGTLASVFPEVLAADARNHSNTLLYAGPPGLAERLRARADRLPPHGRSLALRVLGELRPVAPGTPLTDDHAPVEHLTDRILVRALLRTGGAL